jgi:hypothetical protein
VKEVTYRQGLREMPRLLALAQQATETLDEILGAHASLVTAEWDSGRNGRGDDVLILTLSDWIGSAIGIFEPREWQDPIHLRLGLRQVWADLLRKRTHKQLQELLSSSEGPEGG